MLHRRTPSRTPARRGAVVVAVAIGLVAILGVVALSLDGGLLMDKRRQAFCAADAAALAAASDMYMNWWANKGTDPSGSAAAAARAAAEANGYKHGANGCTIEVHIPPRTGPFAGQAGHTEVIIAHAQPRYFSRLFGSERIDYGARAVSRGRRSSIMNAIICLDPTGKGALNAGGNGGVLVTGAPVQVNSSNAEAMIANGNGTMSANPFLVTGSPGWSTPGGGSFTGTIVPNSVPIPDPLAYLPPPDPSSLILREKNKVQISGNRTVDLLPGLYQGGISASGGTINLAPGIYYMQGGGFNIGGQANLRGTGVMIYNAPTSNSDTISIAGQGSIVLSPPLTGPYQGICFFQDRTSTTPVSVSASPGVEYSITGTFYAASADLSVTGNGENNVIGSQYISYRLNLGGNGKYFCSWDPNLTPGTRDILLVE